MPFPTAHPWVEGDTLGQYLDKRGHARSAEAHAARGDAG